MVKEYLNPIFLKYAQYKLRSILYVSKNLFNYYFIQYDYSENLCLRERYTQSYRMLLVINKFTLT